jgi:hypothetical protein
MVILTAADHQRFTKKVNGVQLQHYAESGYQ